MATLFDPLSIGDLTLPNRVIMAPLTRMRSAQPGNIPWELNAQYYTQRASAGLIVSEATQVSQQGQGYPGTPGIHSEQQIAGWRLITDSVHQAGGRIFLQLWHVGRISHRSHQPGGALPVAPSAIKPQGGIFSAEWKEVPFETPRALETSELAGIIEQFKHGAKNAKAAGFDGVEVHGANGYLLDQFLQDGTNRRSDSYGGSIENRARLLLEIVDAVVEIWGRGRVGVRLSPFGSFNDMHDSNSSVLFGHVLKELDARKIAYVHLVEPRASLSESEADKAVDVVDVAKTFRGIFKGVLISAGGYNRESAIKAVADGLADAVAFGRHFIANPDLPERLQRAAAFNAYDRSTFYGGGEKGYVDYPFLAKQPDACCGAGHGCGYGCGCG